MILSICGSLLTHLEPGVFSVSWCALWSGWSAVSCCSSGTGSLLVVPGWLHRAETTVVLQNCTDRDPRTGCCGRGALEDGWETRGKAVVLPPSYFPFYLY